MRRNARSPEGLPKQNQKVGDPRAESLEQVLEAVLQRAGVPSSDFHIVCRTERPPHQHVWTRGASRQPCLLLQPVLGPSSGMRAVRYFLCLKKAFQSAGSQYVQYIFLRPNRNLPASVIVFFPPKEELSRLRAALLKH